MELKKFIYSLLIIGAFCSCSPISERKQPPPTLYQLANTDLNLDGKQLADAYCANCHLKPEPEVLDKKTWEESVLPDMRMRMGLYLDEDFGSELPEDKGVPEGIYAKTPYITQENWEKLQEYYIENAPEKPLAQKEKATPKNGIPGFKISQPVYDHVSPNLTTMLRIHPESGELWLGHRLEKLMILDPKIGFQIKDSIATDTAPVDINWTGDSSFELLTMGKMDPSNDSVGVISNFTKITEIWQIDTVLENLIRPVNVEYADLDDDGFTDRIVSQFGDHVGKLSLYHSDNSEREEIVMKAQPGSRRTIAVDFDGDGDLDILGLMAQAQEGVYLWENEGEGIFKERALLRFQPAFGSSDFRYEDMNGDGFPDIILVNGDNADQSIILKNFHGVRIFLNDGAENFEESWFYPMHGASGLEVGDFDGNGTLDLFVISFFPDPNQQPNQDLIYFQNSGDGEYVPFVMEEKFDSFWLTLTSGDLDHDGDLDVIVGSFEFDDLYKMTAKEWRPFIVLENQLKN